ncbi:MAG: acetyl-CoA carboxylase biotin carboxyl carrier protein [Spirochaetaceae bacterium]|jgi:acetyl-CoA carboxylase biotin carboxyl carrier protein|nr:acetyl-CoA carboxylase biotin carboxyl carrier protein [Spirochaetaceae bacterium]
MNDELIKNLIDKFSASQVAELDIEEGSLHIILRKECAVRALYQPPAVGAPLTAPPPQLANPADGAVHLSLPGAGTAGDTGSDTAGETITSPIVATFYAAPGPDAPPFVTPGKTVKAGETLCILEAMKMMNHLEAEFDCEIRAVKAGSGELVEYGQVLFEVRRL